MNDYQGTDGGSVNLDTVRVDSQVSTCAIFFSKPAQHFIASTFAEDCEDSLRKNPCESDRSKQAAIKQAKAPKSLSVIDFGFVQDWVLVRWQVLGHVC